MNEFIESYIADILFAINYTTQNGDNLTLGAWQIREAIMGLLPIFLIPFIIITAIAIIALVFGVKSYRTNKKILKKLEEKKGDG